MDTLFLALRVVVSLAAVLGVIWFIQKRLGRGTGTRTTRGRVGGALLRPRAKPLSIVGRQSIGAKAAVAVVEFEGRRFLLGVTEHGISVLDSSAPAVEDEAVAVAPDARFADALDAATLPADAVPLAGSILSAGTWKQAYSALRQAR